MESDAVTVEGYLAGLEPERRERVRAVYDVLRAAMPTGYREAVAWGMITWSVPLERYPDTYNGQPLGICALAAQKNYLALYLMGVYGDPAINAWFQAEYKKSGKKLDMGKSCLRFKTADDLPLELIGKVITKVTPEQYIARYEAVKGPPKKKTAPRDRPAARKRPAPARRAAKRG